MSELDKAGSRRTRHRQTQARPCPVEAINQIIVTNTDITHDLNSVREHNAYLRTGFKWMSQPSQMFDRSPPPRCAEPPSMRGLPGADHRPNPSLPRGADTRAGPGPVRVSAKPPAIWRRCVKRLALGELKNPIQSARWPVGGLGRRCECCLLSEAYQGVIAGRIGKGAAEIAGLLAPGQRVVQGVG